MTPGSVTTVPRRIMVMGPPGSGKSTLARLLGARLALPVWHGDALFHAPGWVTRPRQDFIADMTAVAARPEWVIDGNYSSAHYGSAIRDRLARADRIILLDLPRRVTIPRILRRIARHHGQCRPDSAAGCPERLDIGFLAYCWRWHRAVRPGIVRVLDEAQDRLIRYDRPPSLEQVIADLMG
ncbi:topology modulation protein [Sphingomonas fuzhouensis]|uniref:topology modulation protein n=1 Tax=Sphingomonas fuzhouensis TaxID=3106033 RepID=UPI002AFEBE61|nr:topology modulation protein [Sphingomonas sp. SGZ-02]